MVMRNIKKIGIIGHFGGNENFSDGQTIKTKILYNELKKSTNWEIIKVDTYYKKNNPIKLLKDTLLCLFSAKDIIVLLSGNGMKFYFPLLYFFSKYFHKKVYHDVIGGNLDKYIEKYPNFRKYLNSFEVNWVETEGLKKKILNQKVTNCEVIPNFKRLNIIKKVNLEINEPYKFCIFSRIMKEKGVEDAINTIKKINHKNKRKVCILDLYGNIDKNYESRFNELTKTFGEEISYKGIVPYNESSVILKNYFALLFPTYWDGEGFPGTIVDAFSAGIPVLASDWNCNKEIVSNKEDGIIYPNDEIKDLEEAIEWLIKNKNQMEVLKKNCIEKAENYQPDKYIKQIVIKIKNQKKM